MTWTLPARSRRPLFAHIASLGILALPVVVLALGALRLQSELLLIGAISVGLVAALLVRQREVWRPPASALTVLLYIMSLAWIWFTTVNSPDGFAHFARGLFLLGAMAIFISHDLTRTGVEPRRRAKKLTQRLLVNLRWPEKAVDFDLLPEVRALRDVCRNDPSLAFVLVEDRRPDVQIAGLTALLGRPYWRWDEASIVIRAARTASSPDVRCLAITALKNGRGAEVLRGLAQFLRDPISQVRETAAIALLSEGEERWGFIRGAIRDTLVDPSLVSDGQLPGTAGRIPAIGLCDLTGWAVEPAPLAERAVRTLLAHYDVALSDENNHAIPVELGRQITEEATPAILRVELAALLRKHRRVPVDLLDRMTDADQPGPIRLMAAEIMITTDKNDSSGLDVLRGLGRQSNRDTALAIARILQNHLGMDFGLPASGIVPTPKQSQDVTHRVYQWATGKSSLEETPIPGDLPSPVFGSRDIASSNPGVASPIGKWKSGR